MVIKQNVLSLIQCYSYIQRDSLINQIVYIHQNQTRIEYKSLNASLSFLWLVNRFQTVTSFFFYSLMMSDVTNPYLTELQERQKLIKFIMKA